MATHDERRALLSVACPWCRAGVGVACRVVRGGRAYRDDDDPLEVERRQRQRRPIRVTTLEGMAHGARWQAARGREPEVNAEAVAAHREPVAAGGVSERPW